MTTATPARPVLPPEQIRHYHTQGYLVLRGFLPVGAVAAAADEAEGLARRADLIATPNLRCRWQNHCDTQECRFDAFDPVTDIGPACARLARDRRLLGVLAALFGEEAFLFKDKLIFKPPGATGYDLHQDYTAWPTFPHSFTTALVPLDPADRDNGCTVVYPGYHLLGYLSEPDGMYHGLPPDAVDESRAVPLELHPGDVAVFGGFVPHRSGPNRSDRPRRQLYLSYNAASDGGERWAEHYREFHAWLADRYAEYGKTGVWFR